MPLTVLVVDDDECLLTTLQRLLGKWGYRVVTTNSGSEAIQSLETGLFDMILTDLEMPGVTGIDLLKRVQRMNPTIPTVMMTGSQEIEQAEEALKEGAFDYLLKPFSFGQLRVIMMRVLKYRRVLLQEKEETIMEASENSERTLEGTVCRPDPTKKPCLIGFRPKGHPTTIYYLIGVMEDIEDLEAREVRVKGRIFPDAGVIRVSTLEIIDNE